MSYFRVSILGTLPTGEVWSVNPVYDPTSEVGWIINQPAIDAAALSIANRSVPTELRQLMSLGAVRTGARVEVRNDATDALEYISVQGSSTPSAGTTPLALPLQSALVASIRTNTPGGSGRGRIYWPALGATLTTNGRLNVPTATTVLTGIKAYLAGIEADLEAQFVGVPFNLAVRSKTTHTTPHATRIQVGDVIDTQRRRRDAQPETYTSVNYP